MKNQLFVWIVKLTAVIILLQTLFFKFSGAQESIYIFQTLGVEPYGRIGSGVIELIASILIFIPKTTLIGALLGSGTMLGAVFSHIFVLGVEVQNDGGTLFVLAVITLLSCLFLVYTERNKISELLKFNI